MPTKSRTMPLTSEQEKDIATTIAKDFFQNGIANCVACKSQGKVTRSKESGINHRIITWKYKNGTTAIEHWESSSAPAICQKCWVRKRLAADKPI